MREIPAVYLPDGCYKPVETAWVKKPTLVTRMSQNMFIGFGSVRTELLECTSWQQNVKYREMDVADIGILIRIGQC
jgi:hypothetical protein